MNNGDIVDVLVPFSIKQPAHFDKKGEMAKHMGSVIQCCWYGNRLFGPSGQYYVWDVNDVIMDPTFAQVKEEARKALKQIVWQKQDLDEEGWLNTGVKGMHTMTLEDVLHCWELGRQLSELESKLKEVGITDPASHVREITYETVAGTEKITKEAP